MRPISNNYSSKSILFFTNFFFGHLVSGSQKIANMINPVVDTIVNIKVPLWQAVLLGGTTALVAGRLMQRGLVYYRSSLFHTSANVEGASKGKKKKKEPVMMNGDDTKLVLVIRTDLGMSKGKIAAQCCHATLACYKRATKQVPTVLKAWEYSGQAKVTLKCSNEEEMVELQKRAQSAGLVAHSICDAGRTQIAAGSRTVLGIGPGPIGLIDSVSGHLKLY